MERLAFAIVLCFVGCIAARSAAVATRAEAAPLMTFTYYQGQSDLGPVKRFHWGLLEAVLERTRDTFGDYRLIALPAAPTSRQKYELAQENSAISVAVFSITPQDSARGLVPVRIPIDLGLQGYRVLLIREGDQALFDPVRSLEDLKQLRFGLLPWWSDAEVMRSNGMSVVEGQSYDGLFRMLGARRFDAFSRGATEALNDLARGRHIEPGLAIERHLLLHYPLPTYFWFAADSEGRRRAERVGAGLAAMVADGTLATMIMARYRGDIEELDLAGRRVIELNNPLLDGQDPLQDKRLWYVPHG